MTMNHSTKMLVFNLNKDHYNISLSLSSMIVAELLQTRKQITWMSVLYNVILPGQGPHKTHCGRENMAAILADDMFVCIFVNKNIRISNKISLICSLWSNWQWIIIWKRWYSILTDIFVTRAQWVNLFQLWFKQGFPLERQHCDVLTSDDSVPWYMNAHVSNPMKL